MKTKDIINSLNEKRVEINFVIKADSESHAKQIRATLASDYGIIADFWKDEVRGSLWNTKPERKQEIKDVASNYQSKVTFK